jgi:hypothetical protein
MRVRITTSSGAVYEGLVTQDNGSAISIRTDAGEEKIFAKSTVSIEVISN